MIEEEKFYKLFSKIKLDSYGNLAQFSDLSHFWVLRSQIFDYDLDLKILW